MCGVVSCGAGRDVCLRLLPCFHVLACQQLTSCCTFPCAAVVMCNGLDPANYSGVRLCVRQSPVQLLLTLCTQWLLPQLGHASLGCWMPPVACPHWHSFHSLPTAPLQYEIDMFRAIMPFLGWEERMLDWRCMDRAQLRAQLAANSSSGGGNTVACDLLVAGLPLSTIQLAQGVSFTYPTSG